MSDRYKIAGDLEAFRAMASKLEQVVPPICANCNHYIGAPVGMVVVVCRWHPYGNGDNCSTFEERGDR